MNTKIRNDTASLDDLDEIDRKIVRYLQQNGRESFTKMSEELGMPTSTVRDRTNRLVEHDILRIVGVLNPLKVRERVMANVGVRLSGGDLRSVADQISTLDEVAYVVICAGSFDLLVEVVCRDHSHLLDLISKIRDIPNVSGTETFIYFEIVKEILTWGVPNNWGKI
jgi:Lrp/AsnC family transcriptional regulator for asnA, asnC and gidA